MAYSKDPSKYELGIVQAVARVMEGEVVRLEFEEKRHRNNARGRVAGYIAAMKSARVEGWEAAQGVAVVPVGDFGLEIVSRENAPFARLFDKALEKGAEESEGE